jgi:hypothetical protein
LRHFTDEFLRRASLSFVQPLQSTSDAAAMAAIDWNNLPSIHDGGWED